MSDIDPSNPFAPRNAGGPSFSVPERLRSLTARAEAAEAKLAKAAEALRKCQSAIGTVISPNAIKETTALIAFAQLTEADVRARATLAELTDTGGKA